MKASATERIIQYNNSDDILKKYYQQRLEAAHPSFKVFTAEMNFDGKFVNEIKF